MAVVVEVIFHRRVAGGNVGEIHEYDEDNKLLHALVRGGSVDVINPPDWTLEKYEAKKFTQTNGWLTKATPPVSIPEAPTLEKVEREPRRNKVSTVELQGDKSEDHEVVENS